MFDGATYPSPLDGSIFRWQLNEMRDRALYILYFCTLAAAILFAGTADRMDGRAFLWITGFVAISATAVCFGHKITEPSYATVRPENALRILCCAMTVWASAWPLACWLLVPPHLDDTIRLAVMAAFVAATSQILQVHFATCAGVTLAMLVPTATYFFMSSSDSGTLLGSLSLSFLAVNLAVCRRTNRQLIEAQRSKFKVESTITHLQKRIDSELTERTRLERSLAIAEQACFDKSRFLAAASHDLRQPVHAISLFVAALKSEVFESRSRYLVDRLDRSLAGLDDLFNRLLDMSRLDAGLIVPNLKTIDATSVAQTLESRFAPTAQCKSLEFRTRCHRGLMLRSDPDLLIELLSNLLSNAVRYTTQGGIFLAFRARPTSILIQVWDTGHGISEDDLDYVFDEFVQLGNPSRDRRKGLGLGLAMVKRLSKVLGHRLAVRSRVGRGSVFEIELERGFSAYAVPPVMPEATLSGHEVGGTLVLVVDDEIDVLSAMEAILSSWGCFTILARSPEEAAKYVDSSPRLPDVLITDHRLADHKTGNDVVSAVSKVMTYEPPVIVISGEANSTLERETEEAGWLFMNKPVNATRLYMAVCQALTNAQASDASRDVEQVV